MSTAQTLRTLVRSYREAPTGGRVGDVDQTQTVHLTVVLKPRAAIHPERYAGGRGLRREAFRASVTAPATSRSRRSSPMPSGTACMWTRPSRGGTR